jgi:hypothetical protein
MSHSMKPRYQVGYYTEGRRSFVIDRCEGSLKEAGKRVLGLRAVGYDALIMDSITNLPVPEDAYAKL